MHSTAAKTGLVTFGLSIINLRDRQKGAGRS
jgi:hypothetical protein